MLSERGRGVPSWQVAHRFRKEGAAGVIVPSFAPNAGKGAKNLVLWRWGPTVPHKVAIFDPEGRLPRDDSSWRS